MAEVLAVPEAEFEHWLAEQVRGNPALMHRFRPPCWRLEDRVPGAEGAPAGRHVPDLLPLEGAIPSPEEDLPRRLASQLRLERMSREELSVGLEIVFNLDERGYLAQPLEEVAVRCQVALATARQAQARVMALEPPGCGASNLLHYLSVRVGQAYPDDPFFPGIMLEHGPELLQRRFDAVGKAIGMDAEDAEEYLSMLEAAVAPYPAWEHTRVVRPLTVPIQVVAAASGCTIVPGEAEPPIMLNRAFQAKLRNLPAGEERQRCQRQLADARRTLETVSERRSLVDRVATIAVERQSAWLQTGAPRIRLTMQEVADEVGRHRSNVSRVVQGQVIAWQQSTIPLRRLFTHRGPGLASADQVRLAIREMVQEEDPCRPLSDQQMADALAEQGFTGVKRRTVRNHRVRLEIPRSGERRQVRSAAPRR